MLPGSTGSRISRERGTQSGRSLEIGRLIARSLRAGIDKRAIGHRTMTIDCDVLQADGGTRTAAINGGYIAMQMAFERLLQRGDIKKMPTNYPIAATSIGIVQNTFLLDLDYSEDSQADLDANLVASKEDQVIELQFACEKSLLPREKINDIIDLGMKGIAEIVTLEEKALEAWRAKNGITND